MKLKFSIFIYLAEKNFTKNLLDKIIEQIEKITPPNFLTKDSI